MDEKIYHLSLTEEEAKLYYINSNDRLSHISERNLDLLCHYYGMFGNNLTGSVEQQKQMNDYLAQICALSQKAWDLHDQIEEKEQEKVKEKLNLK